MKPHQEQTGLLQSVGMDAGFRGTIDRVNEIAAFAIGKNIVALDWFYRKVTPLAPTAAVIDTKWRIDPEVSTGNEAHDEIRRFATAVADHLSMINPSVEILRHHSTASYTEEQGKA